MNKNTVDSLGRNKKLMEFINGVVMSSKLIEFINGVVMSTKIIYIKLYSTSVPELTLPLRVQGEHTRFKDNKNNC